MGIEDNTNNKPVFIYALCEPGTRRVRYIGRAFDPYQRFYNHLSPCNLKAHTRKNNWIKSVLRRGEKPDLIILDVGDQYSWSGLETFYIRSYRAAGFALTNVTDGGDGHLGRTPSRTTRLKIAASLKGKSKGRLGLKHTEDTKAKIAASHLGKSYGKLPEDRPCSTCGLRPPDVNFRISPRDGRVAHCIGCEQEARRRRYESKKDQFLEKARERYLANREDIIAYQKEYRKANHGKINEGRRKKYAARTNARAAGVGPEGS